jgi:hypothetical protein
MYETKFMQRVLDLSQQGMQGGHGGPFGCVIVKDGIIVGEAHNEVLSSNDPTAHAELLITSCRWRIPAPSVSATSLFTKSSPGRSINAGSSRWSRSPSSGNRPAPCMSCGPRSRTRSNSEKPRRPILCGERDCNGRVTGALFDRPSPLALTITSRLRSVLKDLEHDPEKWNPVFRKDHAQPKSESGMPTEPQLIPL